MKSLIPIVDRLRGRFAISQICIVADRDMISKTTIEQLEAPRRRWPYILGARMHNQKEVRQEVLSRGGRFRVVHDNRGYREYLRPTKPHFAIDETKIREEARFDGKWVCRTNTEFSAAEVALKYKQLWMVEHVFRSTKSLLETRPIGHKRDETIRGHVFCSLLALLLRKELQDRLEARGEKLPWDDIIQDLKRLPYAEVEQDGKRFRLRSEAQGACSKVFAAADGSAVGGFIIMPSPRRPEPPILVPRPDSTRASRC